MNKDVHTEHCCLLHGCKYGYDDVELMQSIGDNRTCSVTTKEKPQSFPCEYCDDVRSEINHFQLKRPSYFKMTGCANNGGKCELVEDKLKKEVPTIFRCGVNEDNVFFVECPECLIVFRNTIGEDLNAIMVNHSNGNHWYGRKGEKFSP